MGFSNSSYMILNCDNTIAFHLASNLAYLERSNHREVDSLEEIQLICSNELSSVRLPCKGCHKKQLLIDSSKLGIIDIFVLA